MNPKLKPILDELREALAAHYGERLSKLVLFGSQARGDAEEDSDIDVLVVLKGEVNQARERRATLESTADICLKHSVVIQRVVVSDTRYASGDDSFMRNITREGLVL